MSERFRQMNCYILAGGEKNRERDFKSSGELTRLERSYRKYAAIFEKVKLVIKENQATEHYLNYPHVCDSSDQRDPAVGLRAALEDSVSDAVFIGSSNLIDFPLELPVNLIRNYSGETFLGYRIEGDNTSSQPLFGIYSKASLRNHLRENQGAIDLNLLISGGKLLELPDGVDASCISG